MRTAFELALVLYALGVGALCLLAAGRGGERPPIVTPALLFIEVLVVVQAGIDVVRLAIGTPTTELATHLGYLSVSVLVLPLALGAVRGDRGRWGSLALAVGCAVAAVVSIRLEQTLGAPQA